jgi:hypothetical protein
MRAKTLFLHYCLFLPLFGLQAAERAYDFYQPQVKHVTIHEGKLAEGHYAYNHMASVEWFDGRFHAVWGGHAETHKEGVPGQLDLWATSPDFETWSTPQPLAHTGPDALARDPQSVQWQPNLLSFHDRQLWCVWTFNSKDPQLDGLWLSTLDVGAAAWKHRRIQRRQEVDGRLCSIFASQNPVLLASGRVLAPVTLNYRDPKHDAGGGHTATNLVRRWNACLYTDDDGASWRCSTPLSAIDDPEGQWEPFFYEQADGRIRAYTRNFTKAIPPGSQWRFTTVGTGSQKGTPVLFPDDPVLSFMETANCRPQVFSLPSGRYCLLQQDAFVNHRDYQTRVNVALHFSRSGADDFVAACPVSRPGVLSAYPQGVAHGGNLYLAYTVGPGDQPRDIEGALVSPAPRAERYYVWPRSKALVRLQESRDSDGKKHVSRANPDARTALPERKTADGRTVLRFAGRASAGVDLDTLDFARGQSLALRFEAKVLRLQTVGMLILCSLGDRIPLRLGVPANRPDALYAYTREQWRPVADFAPNQWHEVRLTVRGTEFSVAVDSQPPKTFPNPLVNPTPRLYLGDGFEVDYLNSNAGSEFLIDLASLRTKVQ